jgi:hypothetical protein
MLLNLYYFIGLIISIYFFYELVVFEKVFSVIDWYNKFEKITGNKPNKDEFRSESSYDIFITKNLMVIVEGIWILIGFITSNWFIFLFIVLYDNLFSSMFNKKRKLKKYIHLKIHIIKLSLYILMVMNNFHINLDLYEVFKVFLLSL